MNMEWMGLRVLAAAVLLLSSVCQISTAYDVWEGQMCTPKAPDYSGGETKFHRLPDSSNFECCEVITCHRGTYAVPCSEDDPSSTRCVECPAHKYEDRGTVSFDGRRCKMKQFCQNSKGLYETDPGSIIHNRVCQCNVTAGFYPEDPKESNPKFCLNGPKCPAGKELAKDGNCTYCQLGFFKSHRGHGCCQPWTDCEKMGKEVETQGTRSTDAVCLEGSISVLPNEATNASSAPAVVELESREDGSETEGSKTRKLAIGLSCSLILMILIIVVSIWGYRRFRKKRTSSPPIRASEEGQVDEETQLGTGPNSAHSSGYISGDQPNGEGTAAEEPEEKEHLTSPLLPNPANPGQASAGTSGSADEKQQGEQISASSPASQRARDVGEEQEEEETVTSPLLPNLANSGQAPAGHNDNDVLESCGSNSPAMIPGPLGLTDAGDVDVDGPSSSVSSRDSLPADDLGPSSRTLVKERVDDPEMDAVPDTEKEDPLTEEPGMLADPSLDSVGPPLVNLTQDPPNVVNEPSTSANAQAAPPRENNPNKEAAKQQDAGLQEKSHGHFVIQVQNCNNVFFQVGSKNKQDTTLKPEEGGDEVTYEVDSVPSSR